ncbi:MAG: hypothetical protein WCV81_00575 [Microgenomates group bacterium]|jgi:hypothetical protein
MSRERENKVGCSTGGCGGCGCVMTVGLVLTLLGAAIGGRISARIPFTEANVTIAGSVGAKELTREATQSKYITSRIAGSNNFINNTNTLTIGGIEGYEVFIVGQQEGAPWFDLGIDMARRSDLLDK